MMEHDSDSTRSSAKKFHPPWFMRMTRYFYFYNLFDARVSSCCIWYIYIMQFSEVCRSMLLKRFVDVVFLQAIALLYLMFYVICRYMLGKL